MNIALVTPEKISYTHLDKWIIFKDDITILYNKINSTDDMMSEIIGIHDNDDIDFLKYDIIHVHDLETAQKLMKNNIDFVLSLNDMDLNEIESNKKQYLEIIDFSLFTTVNQEKIYDYLNNPQKIYLVHLTVTGFIEKYDILKFYDNIEMFRSNKNENDKFAESFVNLYFKTERATKQENNIQTVKTYEITFLDGSKITNTSLLHNLNVKFCNSETKNIIYEHDLKPGYWCSPSVKYYVPWEIHVDDEIIKFDLIGKNVLIEIDEESKINLIDKWLQAIDIFRIKNACNIFINLPSYAHIFEKTFPNINFHLLDDIEFYASYKLGTDLKNEYYRTPGAIPEKIAEDVLIGDNVVYPDSSLTEEETDNKEYQDILKNIVNEQLSKEIMDNFVPMNIYLKDDNLYFTMVGTKPKITNSGSEDKHIKFINPFDNTILYETTISQNHFTMLNSRSFLNDVIIESNGKPILRMSDILKDKNIVFRVDDYNDIENVKQFIKQNPILNETKVQFYVHVVNDNRVFIISNESVIPTTSHVFLKYFTVIDLRKK